MPLKSSNGQRQSWPVSYMATSKPCDWWAWSSPSQEGYSIFVPESLREFMTNNLFIHACNVRDVLQVVHIVGDSLLCSTSWPQTCDPDSASPVLGSCECSIVPYAQNVLLLNIVLHIQIVWSSLLLVWYDFIWKCSSGEEGGTTYSLGSQERPWALLIQPSSPPKCWGYKCGHRVRWKYSLILIIYYCFGPRSHDIARAGFRTVVFMLRLLSAETGSSRGEDRK